MDAGVLFALIAGVLVFGFLGIVWYRENRWNKQMEEKHGDNVTGYSFWFDPKTNQMMIQEHHGWWQTPGKSVPLKDRL